jgi:two-component sensor histidine kinase
LKLEQQQRQTLEQTAKIESIFNSTENLMMWTLNHDFEITELNANFIKNMESVFGEEVKLSENIMAILQRHVDHNFYQGQLQAFNNGFKGRPQQFELPLKNENNETVWWQCFLNPVYLHGKLEELSCLVYDNTERKEIDRKIRDSLKEKEVLLQEVHHRVKNNLQVISSILNLQSSYVNDPKTLEILRESQQRIKSMSFIHETIYRTADFSRLEFMDYIKTIASNLIQSYRTPATRVDFVPDMHSVGLNLDQAIPCGLIINELVSNALKYAFKGRKKGTLTIILREEKDEVILAVKDDGVGLPKDFAFEKNNSLGIQLVYALLEQIDATVKVDQSNGTEFLIRFRRK